MATICRSEMLARELGEDRKRLEKHLREMRSILRDQNKRRFGKGRFDFATKTLIGLNGRLEWRVRKNPDLPESYRNQQTNCGVVLFIA